jgi:hypothetical protein
MRIRTAVAASFAALAAAVCVTAGCVTAPAVSAATAVRSPDSPRKLAETDATTMLAAFRAPPRAERSRPIAVPALSAAPGGSSSPDFVTRVAWWKVPGTMDAALAWVRAHAPAGFTLGGSGSTTDASVVTSRFDMFSLPPVPSVLAERSLYVSVARDGSDSTAMRVDSQVSWLPVKSPAERIPSAAKVVTILALPAASGSPVRPITRMFLPATITNPATVTKIAEVVDGLQLMPPGVFHCPFSNGQGMRLTFRATKGGPVLAQATAQANGCGTVTLVVDGKRLPVLWGGARLVQQVLKLARLHWAGY